MKDISDILADNMRMAEKILYFSEDKTIIFRSWPKVLIEEDYKYFFVPVYKCYITKHHEIRFVAKVGSREIDRSLYFNLVDTIDRLCNAIYDQKYFECKYLNRILPLFKKDK